MGASLGAVMFGARTPDGGKLFCLYPFGPATEPTQPRL